MQDWPLIKSEFWAAAVIVLRERGRGDITLGMLHDARVANAAERAEFQADQAKSQAIKSEAYWMQWNPGVTPWWTVNDANKHLLATATLAVVRPSVPEQSTGDAA